MNFVNFDQDDSIIVIDALEFTQATILEQYKKITNKIKPPLKEHAWEDYKKIVIPIYESRDFFLKNLDRQFITNLDDDYFESLMDKVASSLLIYRRYLKETIKNTGINSFNELIKKVDKILALPTPKKANNKLFDKFYPKKTKKVTLDIFTIFLYS